MLDRSVELFHEHFYVKVRAVNKWIEEFNREATGVQLDLGVYGIEGDPMVGEVKI